MDDILVDSGHLQAHICEEAVETDAIWVSQRQSSLSFVLPLCTAVHTDLFFILPSAQLPKEDV